MFAFLAILFTFSLSAQADFIWDELPKNLPTHENFVKSASSGLSVFWWNTQMGEMNQQIYRERKFYPLDTNLKELSESQYLPDLIVLGEYNEKNFSVKTIWDLKKVYPHQEVVVNNVISKKDIAIFSRFPFTVKTQPLIWYASQEQKKKFEKIYSNNHKFFDRQFIHVEVNKNNKKFHLIPAHLLNQWADLLAYFQKKLGKDLGKIKFGEEMVEGQFNPLMYQIRALKGKIEKEIGNNPHVIFGDMNCPSLVYNLPVACHNRLNFNSTDSMSNDQPSYPAASATSVVKMPPMKIDHAIHSKNLVMKHPRVLPLLGSDHYPLMFVIQNAKK